MRKPNPTKKQKRRIASPVAKVLSFMEDNLPDFLQTLPYDKSDIIHIGEDNLTEHLVVFLLTNARTEDFSFMAQATQKGRRTVDIGVFLFGNPLNYIFCIEAKFLPHSPFDYVTGEHAAIKRFKAKEHGLSNSLDKVPLPQNGIIAYVRSGSFEAHLSKINQKLQKLSNIYSQSPDKFGLTWGESEQLGKVYFKTIGRLSSKHSRKEASDVNLSHFWINLCVVD